MLSGDRVVGAWMITVTGDVNGDGQLSITDMIAVNAHVLQKTLLSGVYAQAADTSGDHNVSIRTSFRSRAIFSGRAKSRRINWLEV